MNHGKVETRQYPLILIFPAHEAKDDHNRNEANVHKGKDTDSLQDVRWCWVLHALHLLLFISLVDIKMSGMTLANDIALSSLQFVLGAMTLVAALAWNQAFSNFFDTHPRLRQFGPWVYASAVTAIAACVGVGITRLRSTLKSNGAKNLLTA